MIANKISAIFTNKFQPRQAHEFPRARIGNRGYEAPDNVLHGNGRAPPDRLKCRFPGNAGRADADIGSKGGSVRHVAAEEHKQRVVDPCRPQAAHKVTKAASKAPPERVHPIRKECLRFCERRNPEAASILLICARSSLESRVRIG